MKSENILKKTTVFTLIILFAFVCVMSTGLYSQPADEEEKKESNGKIDEETKEKLQRGWRTRDYKPYIKAMEDLRKLSTAYSEKNLQLAINEYDKGMDVLDDMENEVLKIESKDQRSNFLNERWLWQEIDRKNQKKRQIYRMKYAAKMKSVSYFIRAIRLIDDIANHNKKFITDNKSFKIFRVRLFQIYISTQYDLQNFRPCIPILERYITLSNETKNDVWAYRYLTSCYGFMEKVLGKYKSATEDEILAYKQKKNRALLKAAELKYDVKSPEYKRLKDQVERDEMKSEMLNDFR